MTDENNQEPTMEEILASIRRIISEDDAPASAPVDQAPPHGDELAATPEPEPEQAPEEVLELTDRVEDAAPPEPEPAPPAAMESVGDLDVFPAARAPAPPSPPEEPLVSPTSASSAASSFAALSQTISMPRDGRTLDDVVRELLKPLLKDWLDSNLPRIVENAVQTEVERIARRHGA